MSFSTSIRGDGHIEFCSRLECAFLYIHCRCYIILTLNYTGSRGPWCKCITVVMPTAITKPHASQDASRTKATPTPPPAGPGRQGWTKKKEYSVNSSKAVPFEKILTRPCGLHGLSIDSTTAELRWSSPSPRNTATKLHVELGWSCKSSPPGSGLQHDMWVTAPALVAGERVLKNNLVPGAMYHFRVRYAYPGSRASEPGELVLYCRFITLAYENNILH
jgi:hypothetical protein